jgi:hypothetical protein
MRWLFLRPFVGPGLPSPIEREVEAWAQAFDEAKLKVKARIEGLGLARLGLAHGGASG